MVMGLKEGLNEGVKPICLIIGKGAATPLLAAPAAARKDTRNLGVLGKRALRSPYVLCV